MLVILLHLKVLSIENNILKSKRLACLLIYTLSFTSFYAQTATISGIVFDENKNPLSNVNISYSEGGTTTNTNGFYVLNLVADKPFSITFSHLGFKEVVLQNLILNTNESFEFNPILTTSAVQIDEIEVSASGQKIVTAIETISPELVRKIPGANAGVETLLKLLPGVSFNNELSTQYNVRGGNFDENLIYINGVEVYRPFLIRSAQQEGFSFINSNMVSDIDFSAGGFQAKYGDKLSSVLDITYKTPTSFGVQASASLLGASATLETISKNSSLTTITGLRYRNNSLLVNSQQTQSNLSPSFVDAQTFLKYHFNTKINLSFLGNFSRNDYKNEPISRQTNFGTFAEPRALVIAYEGNERNTYQTEFGAFSTNYLPSNNVKLTATASIYHTKENEFSDVIAAYELGNVNTDFESEQFGEIVNPGDAGSQQTRARNLLDILLFNLTHKGSFKKDKKLLEWGIKYAYEDVRDELRETEFLDSAGFFLRPPNPEFINNQPQEPFTGEILPYEQVFAQNFVTTQRTSAFLQFSNSIKWGNADVFYNLGLRAQLWTLKGAFEANTQFIFSPRGQLAIKPSWEKDMLFSFALGSYKQPPFYRELRNLQGVVQPNVETQKSIHFVLGNEYSFTIWNRPFKLTSEAYYKNLTNVNTYTIEDVRLRYRANNDAIAYAYGFDFRLNGSLIPGEESWLSVGYLNTKENQNERGYISRPTDQRFKLGFLFQDYMPTIPNLKLYLNLVYNTGVPGGSPNNEDPYIFQNRLRDYRRADLGISYIFANRNFTHPQGHWLHKFKEFTVGFEIFNLFNNQNSITNTWVRDIETQQQFAVPNFLTSRILNLKVDARF
ncbi:TonB-dependent receptor [Croceivirga lutea]|nr:carboxypeptidase regulatory-like domain-containing protein [Croceivirga lutea]GGG49081.1 TonB-dependent receptor [Croceivirga lutea]